MIYNTDGSLAVTVVPGTSRVGFQAEDGSINIVLDDTLGRGIYHACGAIRVNSDEGETVYDSSGAFYINKLFGVRATPSTTDDVSDGGPTNPVGVFSANPALDGDDANFNTTFRVICTLSEDLGDQIRLTLTAGGGGPLTITHVGVGKYTGDPARADTVATPEELFFSSASGFTDLAANTNKTSDWLTHSLGALTAGDKVVISYTTGASGHAYQKYNAASTNSETFYQTGSLWDASDTTGLGFNDIDNKNYAVATIETRNLTGGDATIYHADTTLKTADTTTLTADYGSASGDIPLTWSDSRYSTNVAGPDLSGGAPILTAPQTYTNKDWDGGELLESSNGNTPIANWATGTGTITFDKCRIRWQEGLRQGTEVGITTVVNECYFESFGLAIDDHADCIQGDGSLGNITLTNTTLRCYSDAEAKALTGSSNAVGSDGFRYADSSGGTVTFENVLIHGGGRGISMGQDAGTTTHISFENVYIVPEGAGFAGSGFYAMRFDDTAGGTRVIDNWTNVRWATIVDGEIIPGEIINQPASTGYVEIAG